jgi:hypothetical protein
MRRILLVLAVAAMMVALAAPSAGADHLAQHDPADPSGWCFGGVPERIDTCFTSRADCEDARQDLEGTTPCEHGKPRI